MRIALTCLLGVIVSLLVATGVAAYSGQQQDNPGGANQKPAAQKEVHGIKPERVQACLDASDRILKEFREKGADASFSGSDLGMQRTCRVMLMVSDVHLVASNPLPQHKKHIKLELFQKAEEISARVLAEFNERAEYASYTRSDLVMMDTFREAIAAVDAIETAASPKKTKGVAPELVQSAREAAQRILAQFNEQGYEARFSYDDEERLREFENALPKDKETGEKK